MHIYAKADLEKYRLMAGLSVRALAEKADLAFPTISRMGSRPVQPSTAGKICKALNTPFDVVFELKDD